MCGIMGYIGGRSAKDIVYTGLKQQEYRGYDSAGIAVIDNKTELTKVLGDTSGLDLDNLPATALAGIGHTRWATHGKPSQINAHPHVFGDIVLVHNGIIENFEQLKTTIDAKKLKSQTDSEVLAAVINRHYQNLKSEQVESVEPAKSSKSQKSLKASKLDSSKKDVKASTNKTTGDNLLEAIRKALAEVKGTFGLLAMTRKDPTTIIAARRGSPVVIGVDDEQYYLASDPGAIIDHTDKVVYLDDDQVARVTRSGLEIFDLKLQAQDVSITQLEELDHKAELGDFGSFLEKEIFEQPASLTNTMRGRVGEDGSIVLGGPSLSLEEMQKIKDILIIGCGSAYYAGYYAKYRLEEMLDIQVSVEHASEFRYRHGAYEADKTLAIFVSQSGETADTLASLQEAKRRGMMTMGIVNAVGSSVAREVDHGGIYLHAGIETSVASTKAFTCMVTALLMLGGFMTNKLGKNQVIMRSLAKELNILPVEIEATLSLKSQIDKIANKLYSKHDWFFLGRGELYPVALEGALKLAELAYTHAQALPSGEMKHGPISLIDKNHVSVLLLPEDGLLYEKGISSLQEIKARGGTVLTVSTRSKPTDSDHHIEIAHSGAHTDGLIMNACLQLLALEIATRNNRNIDRPRNLAKSVTVE